MAARRPKSDVKLGVFFRGTVALEIYTLSLDEARPIWKWGSSGCFRRRRLSKSARECIACAAGALANGVGPGASAASPRLRRHPCGGGKLRRGIRGCLKIGSAHV